MVERAYSGIRLRRGLLLLLPLMLAACAGGERPQARFAPAPASYFTVSARPGDSLSQLAARYQVSEDDVLALNNLRTGSKLPPGPVRIPAYGRLADRSETQPQPAPVQAPPAPVPAPIAAAPLRNAPVAVTLIPAPRVEQKMPQPARQSPWMDMEWLSPFTADMPAPKPGTVTFLWPVQGKILANFGVNGSGLRNDGIDILTPRGTPVRAAGDGTVSYVGDELTAYGKLVLIRHSDGFITAYAHSDAVVVKRGQRVRRGDVIAYAGATGDVSEPQLHFELRFGAKPVDPNPYLVAAK
jgi:murein DD-endopeptidase MepM/ murein hydrolase activator NlpD